MDKQPEFAAAYSREVHNLLEEGYATKITTRKSPEGRTWYLPHFGVTNINKPGKLRLVFDAAAKTHGVSLNDNLISGPDLLNTLPGELMRFRQYPIAIIGDIKEMFLQIKIRPEDQSVQRFLWRGMNRQRKPDVYCMTSMIFRATCSPCSAQYVKNRNAQEFEAEFPQAVQAILRRHYMDDYLDSVDTEQQAIDLADSVKEVHR